MRTPGFSVRLDTTGDTACVYVTGELDMATADHLSDCISLALKATSTTELGIDLGRVTFCDSAGLQALVNAQRACQKRQVGLVLHGPDDRLLEILKIAGLGSHFTIEP